MLIVIWLGLKNNNIQTWTEFEMDRLFVWLVGMQTLQQANIFWKE